MNEGWCDLNRGKINEGIKAFEQAQWDESLQNFQDALLDDPENPIGHYDVGQALYKKKNYQEALASYEKALSSQDLALKQKSYYNLGNTYYQLNKYQEAIQNYIKALDLDPNDQDAKHNLELVRAKLKELAEKQPMQNQPQPQQEQQSSQQQDQQQNEQQQQQTEPSEEQEEQQQPQKNEQQQEAQKVEKQKELSKEEAERILQALKSEEKENQKLRRQKMPAGKRQVEKDW
jgi:Ca-activated chloride channel family protein